MGPDERRTVTEGAGPDRGDSSDVPGRAFDVVVMAASAGGLAALSAVLGSLPADFPVPVVVVQHLDPRHPSLLVDILRRRTPLHVEQAVEGTRLAPGCVYLAPPDQHVLVTAEGALGLSHAEQVHFVRPSADLLFESAASSFSGRVVAVVLTGTGTDANMGVRAVDQAGGTVLVQDPATAEFAGMPQAAVATGGVDLVLALEEIGPTLLVLAGEGAGR